MSSCNRFEKEGLLILQKGGQLDEHFSTCQSCIDAQQKHAALEQFIKVAGSASMPAEGWQKKVLESVEKQNEVGPRFWPKGIAAGFATVMVTGFLINQFASQTQPPGGLEIMLASSDRVYRGTAIINQAKRGDSLEFTASQRNRGSQQIRVYRDLQLYKACGTTSPCKLKEGAASLRVEMKALGEYTALLIESNKAIEFIENKLDQDVTLAHESSAEITVSNSITVQ